MTASRASGWILAAALFAVLTVPAPVLGQSGGAVSKPLSLAPPTALTPKSAAPAEQTPENEPAGTGIRVNRLDRLDPDSVGLLNPGGGGLDGDMWRGTSRAFVDQVLPHLPTAAPSAAMRDLMRRLLLSTARAPVGQARPGDLVATRARLLVALGDAAGAGGLIAATPVRGSNELLNRAEAEARFLTYDLAPACRIAAAQVGQGQDMFWQKALTFCQMLAGERDRATLGVNLLHEMNVDDPVFFALMAVLEAGKPAKLKSLENPTPLHLAMARAGKATLPADVLAAGDAAVLHVVAGNAELPDALRLEAAEKAISGGTPMHETQRQLYDAIPFEDEELANPLSSAEQMGGIEARALLYRAARDQTIPTARAETLAKALELAQADGRFETVAHAFLDILKALRPAPELAWFAPDAARALMILNEREQARRWLTLVRAAGRSDEEMARAQRALLPLVLIAGVTDHPAWGIEHLAGWWRDAREDPTASGRGALLLSLLEALGEPVSPQLWAELMDLSERGQAALPHPSVLRRLDRAASAPRGHETRVASATEEMPEEPIGRLGETLMLSLVALGEAGPQHAHPELLHRVIDSLVRVGLVDDARRLALEAAIAAGL